MILESSDEKDIDGAFERCKNALKLKDNIDPFAEFVGRGGPHPSDHYLPVLSFCSALVSSDLFCI